MPREETKKAANGGVAFTSPNKGSNTAEKSGLNRKPTRRRAGVPCAASSQQAKMIPFRRSAECGGRSPLQYHRRMTAAPRAFAPTAFSFGGVRSGRIAPAVYLQVCGLTPCGEPSGSPLPMVRYFLHPHGVALLVGREGDSRNLTIGGRIMADPLQRAGRTPAPNTGANTDALPPFTSAAFLQGTAFAEERALGCVLNAVATNDVEKLARCEGECRTVAANIADALQLCANTLGAPCALDAADARRAGALIGLLADVLQVVNAADEQRADAEYRLRG